MKRKNIIVLILSMILLLSISFVFRFARVREMTKEEKLKSLINIDKLSEKFIDNYFEEVEELNKSENKENILIVISEKEIKDGYGAAKIIEAPNNQYIIQYNSEEEKNRAIIKFKDEESILSVEENTKYEFYENSDTNSYNSWGIKFTGLNKAINFIESQNFDEVVVAILDTGCDMELFNQYYSGKIIETYNIMTDSQNDMYDNYGHGTHISGTIAEGTPNNVKIIPVKMSDDGSVDEINILKAINWIVYNQNADIMNMSFGNDNRSIAIEQAIEAANEKNIVTVAAAGNSSTAKISYPAGYENTISVSAINEDYSLAPYSNFGSTITFAAPGTSILSINGIKSGTSMASPHVVCAVAILKSFNKSYNHNEIVDILKTISTDLGSEGQDIYYGYGLIDFNVVEFCSGMDCDEFGIFKEKYNGDEYISRIEIPDIDVGIYNYKNITNLMHATINIYYQDETFVTKSFYELNDLDIENYDPNSFIEQVIKVTYKGHSTNVNVDNRRASYNSPYQYEKINDNEISLRITSDVTALRKKVYIPDEIDGYTVVKLAGINHLVEYVILPASVSTIGQYAFSGSNVKDIDFMATSIKVEDSAFRRAKYLSKIDAEIESIGIGSFAECDLLSEVTLSDDITSIPDEAFNKSFSLVNINIPDSVTKIGKEAFKYTSISNLILSDTITEIGEGAFENCANLIEINIPKNLTIISNRTFAGTSITSVVLPDGIVEIGEWAFADNLNLESVILNDNLALIKHSAFCRTNIQSIAIPDNVKEIADYTFLECFNLKDISWPKNLEKIGMSAFAYTSLDKYDIPDSVTYIGNGAFASTKISQVVLSKNVTTFGNGVFTGTPKVQLTVDSENPIYDSRDNSNAIIETESNTLVEGCSNSVIPNDIEIIGDQAFLGLSDLKEIAIPDSVKSIGFLSFYNSGLEKVTLSNNLEVIGVGSFQNTNISEISLPNSLISIGYLAFAENKIKNINLPDSLEEIGDNAFSATELEEINIPKSVRIIGSGILSNSKIKRIVVDQNNSNYNSDNDCNCIIENNTNKLISGSSNSIIPRNKKIIIGSQSFMGIEIEELYIPSNVSEIESTAISFCKNLKKVIMEEGVEKIGSSAFVEDSSLNKVVVPSSVKEFGNNIFANTSPSMVIWGYEGSEAINYAINNNLPHEIIESPTNITVELPKTSYKAFEKVDTTGLNIRVTYENSLEERIIDSYTIEYNNSNDSFRYGDENFTLYAITENDIPIKKQVAITVSKAMPKYTIPENLTGNDSNKLSSIVLPQGFEWMDGNEILSRTKTKYLAKYIPEDTANYEIVENIEIQIEVEKIDDALILREGIEIKEDKYIIGIKENETINELELVTSNNIKYYDEEIEITDLTTKIKTGMKITAGKEEYYLVVNGDINGDGNINSGDLLKVRQHLLEINELKESNYIAADINGDSQINSADLLRIRQHLLSIKGIV